MTGARWPRRVLLKGRGQGDEEQGRGLLLPYLAFGSRLQPLDVLAVGVEQQQRQNDEQGRKRGMAEPPQENRRHESRDQRRERRIARRQGSGDPERAEHGGGRPEQS